MAFWNKKPKQKPDFLSRLVTWAFLLFIAYAAMHINTQNSTNATRDRSDTKTHPAEKDCNKDTLHSLPLFSMPILPSMSPMLRSEDIVVGSGEPAQCGQTATLRFSYATQKDDSIFDTLHSTTPADAVRIGSPGLLHGLQDGLTGMKAGGTRTLLMAPALAFQNVDDMHTLLHADQFQFPKNSDIRKTIIKAEVKLLSLNPEIPSSPFPLRMIDSKIGGGARSECGDKITVSLTLWKLDGTLIYSTPNDAPLVFTIGASQVPFGIEKAAVGMFEGSQRTAIIPPAYTKPLDASAEPLKAFTDIPWPEQEVVLVEITRVPAVEKPIATTPDKK